ncbi:hypothetical protein B0J15DRAFT_565816 [Fusarium solani]|uniref:Uncharacterized protein n=1 Tax=Fusarium solani TaxID=169388 RepID=A0A9P9GP40_FUSSL|nr:uncharacterized protein B0J15DRAFT_565816 [Fusarium solani]KAH7242905.1 hypothetical protein B0J15DRAFT_565816 [Fusarium solani]
MRLFKLMRLVWAALIREGASQALPPRTLAYAEPGTESWRSDHEFRRRQDGESLEDLISGTLTLTIAPDETCGFYGNGPTYYACGGSACTWESGTINRMFCGWDNLETACFDKTDTCDNDCLKGYSRQCTGSIYTVCELVYLGEGIYGHNCVDTKVGLTLNTARGREPGDFTTMVVVNRSQVSLIVGDDGKVEIGAIVGGVVGGLAVVGLTIGFLGFMCLRRRNHQVNTTSPNPAYHDQQQPYTPEAKGTPFDRLRRLVGGSNPPVELPGDTVPPNMAYTYERSGTGS